MSDNPQIFGGVPILSPVSSYRTHVASSADASPLSPAKFERELAYDRADKEKVDNDQTLLKENCCQYHIYADSSSLDLSQFNQRVSFLRLLLDEKSGKGISLLTEETLKRALPTFVATDEETADENDVNVSIREVLTVINKLNDNQNFPFINDKHSVSEKVELVVGFLAHPLHFQYGALLLDGSPYGFNVTRDDLLDAYDGREVTIDLRNVLNQAIEKENPVSKDKFHDAVAKAQPRELATYIHRWLMALQRTTNAVQEYVETRMGFFKTLLSSFEAFPKTSEESHDHRARKETTDNAIELFSVLIDVGKKKTVDHVCWREEVRKREEDMRDNEWIKNLCLLLTTEDYEGLLETMTDSEGEAVRKFFEKANGFEHSSDLKQLIGETSGHHSRGTDLRTKTIEKRLKVILKHLMTLRNDLQLDYIFQITKDSSPIVVTIEHSKDENSSVIKSHRCEYLGGNEIIDIGFRLDGNLLVLDRKVVNHTTFMRVCWSSAREPTIKYIDDMTPAELLNKKECVIKTSSEDGWMTIIVKENSSIDGFETEIEGKHPCKPPCKPRFFDVDGVPCQRIALLWDGTNHNQSISETARDIALALNYESELISKRAANAPIPPLPDVIRLFTTKWLRDTYLKESSKLLDAEWKELATGCHWVHDVLTEKYWLFFLPAGEITRLTVHLAKAKIQVKRVTADQQSFTSKLSELRSSAPEGNTVVHLNLLGKVESATFLNILSLQETHLRIIMTESSATFLLYDNIPEKSNNNIYPPAEFATTFANVQTSKLSKGESSSLARIVSIPPKAINPLSLTQVFTDFARQYARKTSLSCVDGELIKTEDKMLEIVLLKCPKNIRDEYFKRNSIKFVQSADMGDEVPEKAGFDAMISAAEQKSYTLKCQNSQTCKLVVVWSESPFRTDHYMMYSRGFRTANRIVRLRSCDPVEKVTFEEFKNLFPLCQLLNVPACILLWNYLLRNPKTKDMCDGEVGEVPNENRNIQWPEKNWLGPWDCEYKYSLPETSSTPFVDVLKSDLDNYEFGKKECNWAEFNLRGFGSSDSLFMSCLASVSHKLRLLCAMPEKQLNTAVSQQSKIMTTFTAAVFGDVADSLSCPLVQTRFEQVAQEGIMCPCVGLLKWNLWQFNTHNRFAFSSKNLLEAMCVPQVILSVPQIENESLGRLIIQLDEPTGPVFRSALDLQPSVRDWVLSLAELANKNAYTVGSAVQRLLLRMRNNTVRHSWRAIGDWAAFEPLFLKQEYQSRKWLDYLSHNALSVVIAALPMDVALRSQRVLGAIAEIVGRSSTVRESCTNVVNEAVRNQSEFSSRNAAALVAEAFDHIELDRLDNLDIRHVYMILSARKQGDAAALQTALHEAMSDWTASGFAYEELPLVSDAFKEVLLTAVGQDTSVIDVLRTIRFVSPVQGTQCVSRSQALLYQEIVMKLDQAAPLQLVAALWYLAPDTQLASSIVPIDICEVLLPLIEQDAHWKAFSDDVKSNVGLMPQFALALCGCHEYLDDFSYSLFRSACFPNWPELRTKTILVATESPQNGMTAHTVTITERAIPVPALLSIGICRGSFSLTRPFQKDLSKARFDLTSGVSRTSIQLNLQALVNGREFHAKMSAGRNAPSEPQCEVDQFFMRALIVAWFQSFGIGADVNSQDGIHMLLASQEDQDEIKRVLTEMQVPKTRQTTNGVWALAFPSTTSSCIQHKSSALQLFEEDSASQVFTQVKMRRCYETCGPAQGAPEAPRDKSEVYTVGFATAARFMVNSVRSANVTSTTPLNVLLSPLSEFSAFCRQLQRSCPGAWHPNSDRLNQVLEGYVNGCIQVGGQPPSCHAAYGISAFMVSIGFATTTSQKCLLLLYNIVAKIPAGGPKLVLTSVDKLLRYLMDTTFVSVLLPNIDCHLFEIAAKDITAQNTELIKRCGGCKINTFTDLDALPQAGKIKLGGIQAVPDALCTSLITKIGSFFDNQIGVLSSESMRAEQLVETVAEARIVVAESILSIELDDKKLNPFFLQLVLKSGFSIVLTTHTTASGAEGFVFDREIEPDAKVVQKFSTSLDAWRYCCSLAPGSVLVCMGFFLVMSKNHEWLLYLSSHPLEIYNPPTALHFLGSHKLLDSRMGPKVQALLEHFCRLAEDWKGPVFDIRDKDETTLPLVSARVRESPSSIIPPINICQVKAASTLAKRVRYEEKDKPEENPPNLSPINSKFLYTRAVDPEENCCTLVRQLSKFFAVVHAQKPSADDRFFDHVTFESIGTAYNLQDAAAQEGLKKLNSTKHGKLMVTVREALVEIQAFNEFADLIFNSKIVKNEPFVVAFAENKSLIECFSTVTMKVSSLWEKLGGGPIDAGKCRRPNPLLISVERGVNLIPAEIGFGHTAVTAGMSDCVNILFGNDYYDGKATASHFIYRPPLYEHLGKNTYNNVKLGYLFDTRMLDEDIIPQDLVSEFKRWLYFVASAPIPANVQSWLTDTTLTELHENPPKPPEAKHQQIMTWCLADRCPIKDKRFTLVNSLKLNSELADICVRGDSRYGVVCVPEVSAVYSNSTFAAESTWFDGRTEEDQYTEIIGHFGPKTTHVIVRNKDKDRPSIAVTAPRSLMKWIAEYTEQHPWHFVVFENFLTFHCEPELRDRIVNQIQPTQERFRGKGNVKFVEHGVTDIVTDEVKTEVPNGDFKKFIQKGVEGEDPFVVLLESCPGLGKTYAMRQLEVEAKCNFFRVDASDARLVKETMIEVLNKTLPFGPEGPSKDSKGNRVQCALVVDEFHLTRSDQKKRELAAWVRPRLGWLKVVLIANRTDAVDNGILGELRTVLGTDQVVKLRAYMTSTIIERAYGKDKSFEGRLDLFTTTLLVLRLIFGAEAASLRLKTYFCGGSIESVRRAVSTVISDKLIMFGDIAPQAVLDHIFGLYGGKEQTIAKTANTLKGRIESTLAQGMDPLLLLSLIAMYSVAIQKDGKPVANDLLDFEEYSANLHHIHPVARLFYWARYVLKHSNMVLTRNQEETLMSTMQKLSVMNQDRFPIVLGVNSGNCSLLSSLAILTEGDLTDPKWMADAINSGKQLDWDLVKEEWSQLTFLDPIGLDVLIGVMRRQPGILVAALPPSIVFRILSENARQPSLRRIIIDHKHPSDIAKDCKSSESAFMIAVWSEVKCQNLRDWEESPTTVLIECVSREKVASNICRAYKYDVLSSYEKLAAAAIVMRWVSSNIAVGECVPDGAAANLCLARMLASLTNELFQEVISSDAGHLREIIGLIVDIWNGSFACLMPLSSEICQQMAREGEEIVVDLEDKALTLDILCEMVQHIKGSLPPEWPKEMCHLRAVMSLEATEEATRSAANLIQNHIENLPSHLVGAFVSSPFASASEHLRLLRSVLKVPIRVDFEDADNDVEVIRKKNIEKAVVALLSIDDIKVKGKLGIEARSQWSLLHRGDVDEDLPNPDQQLRQQ